MARTNKIGIDYFPLDVDFFIDDKIQLIEAEFGSKGGYIIVRLLCKIYREGYYYQWGGDECLLFTKNMGAEFVPNMVNEVVNGLVRRCFFDKGCFDRFGILTSKGIQERYFEITKRYNEVSVFKEYLLVDVSKFNNVNIIPINANIIPINDNTNQQKKIKEIKLNKINQEEDVVVEEKNTLTISSWRTDFQIYKSELLIAYKKFTENEDFIKEYENYYENIDVIATLKKDCKEFWSLENKGWKHKKKDKNTQNIDWFQTFRNILSNKNKRIYKHKNNN